MQHRNTVLVIIVVLFCIVFPSAQVRHSLSSWAGIPSVTPVITDSSQPCDTQDESTVDHTVCGNAFTTVIDILVTNVRTNFALLGMSSVFAPTRDEVAVAPSATMTPAIVATETIPATATRPAATATVQYTATIPATQLATATPTTPPIPTATATMQMVVKPTQRAIVTNRTATPAKPSTTAQPATATAQPATATAQPVSVDTPPPTVAPQVILPASILDGFRYRMPVNGYWDHTKDGIYVAVGSFKYLDTFYAFTAPAKKRFVVCSLTIANIRTNGVDAYVDRTNLTLTDIDGNQVSAVLEGDELSQALQASRIAPGQRVGGQVAFLIDEYTAPGQLTISTANLDEYTSRTTQTIELRVWPIIP